MRGKYKILKKILKIYIYIKRKLTKNVGCKENSDGEEEKMFINKKIVMKKIFMLKTNVMINFCDQNNL